MGVFSTQCEYYRTQKLLNKLFSYKQIYLLPISLILILLTKSCFILMRFKAFNQFFVFSVRHGFFFHLVNACFITSDHFSYPKYEFKELPDYEHMQKLKILVKSDIILLHLPQFGQVFIIFLLPTKLWQCMPNIQNAGISKGLSQYADANTIFPSKKGLNTNELRIHF